VKSSSRSAVDKPLRVFALTWFGQLISIVGSGLTNFALGVEVYARTKSVTQFSLITFFYFFPMMVLSPIAGALVDRWDRRRAMLFSDLGAGMGSLSIWFLLIADRTGYHALEAWHFYLPILVGSAFGAFRWPAYLASTALLVPKAQLGRANGLIELATGAGQVTAPVLAAALLSRIGLEGVVLIDVASFVFAVGSLLLVRFPRPVATVEGRASKGSLGQEIGYGFSFIRARPGLFGLLLFFSFLNLSWGLISVLITPLILSFADVSTLGMVLSVAGLGMVLGGISMSIWGGPKRRMHGVLGFSLLSGIALLLGAAPQSATLIGFAAALFLFTAPAVSGSAQTIWQSKVPPELHGRVFALRRMVSLGALPLAGLIAGPLSDRFFEPWMREGGALAGSVGRVMGTGPGRGIGLLFVLLGFLIGCAVLVTWLSPRTRNVEDELPDELPDRDANVAVVEALSPEAKG